MPDSAPFWELKSLDELDDEEWESLCDRCGRCCLQKLEDEDSGEVHYTDVACKLLDTDACQCSHYASRHKYVSDCIEVRPLDAEKLAWLPDSCAYKTLHEGRQLQSWHPLISGDPASVHTCGIGMAGRCQSEQEVPVVELVHHLISFDR